MFFRKRQLVFLFLLVLPFHLVKPSRPSLSRAPFDRATRAQRDARTALLALVETTRQLYLDVGYGLLADVKVSTRWEHDTWDEGGRTVACYLVSKKGEIYLSPRLATFPVSTQKAIIAHEFGHAVQAHYTGFSKSYDKDECGADSIAEQVCQRRIFYAPFSKDDPRLLQTFRRTADSVRPRPAGLR